MKTIKINSVEEKVVKLLLYAYYKTYVDRVGHAASHGDEYSDPFGNAAESLIDKIEAAKDAR